VAPSGPPPPVEIPGRDHEGASQRGDRESAPGDTKIAEKQSGEHNDSARRYYAPDQAIEPTQRKGLTVHGIIPVSSPSAHAGARYPDKVAYVLVRLANWWQRGNAAARRTGVFQSREKSTPGSFSTANGASSTVFPKTPHVK
jgi:hypothetical protein